MNFHTLENEIRQMGNWWHKLIWVYDAENSLKIDQWNGKSNDIQCLNINLVLSQALVSISKNKYPLYVEEFIDSTIHNSSAIYLLNHIDILFDPVLQTNPIRLFENFSKRYKLIIMWPGEYQAGKLIYAESGHPEHFVCDEFEGKVITVER